MATRQYIDSFAQPTAADTTLNTSYTAGDPTITVTSLPADVAVKGAPFYIRIGSTIFDVTALSGTGNKTWTISRDVRTADNNYSAGSNVFLDHISRDHEALLQNALLVAKGYLVTATAAETPVGIAPGANGEVLTADSTVANGVRWGTAGGGALVLLESHIASASATLDFTTFISSTYDEYLIELVSILPANSAVQFFLRMSTDGGATYDSTAVYEWGGFRWVGGGSATSGGTADTSIGLASNGSLGNGATSSFNGHLRLSNPESSAMHKHVWGQASYIDSLGSYVGVSTFGVYKITTAVNALRFAMSAGNISSGTIRAYGIAK